MAAKKKKLYRSKTNKVLTGLFGGLGDYFNIDATVLRVAFLAFLALTGFLPGIVIYVIAALLVPQK